MFKIDILGSSSSGNAYLVDTGDAKLLLDIGFTFKQVKERLAKFGASLDMIDKVLITHSHGDHVKGLRLAVKNFSVPSVMSLGTLMSVDFDSSFTDIISDGESIDVNGTKIEAFSVPHNTDEPLGFSITNSKGERLLYLTDCGAIPIGDFFNYEVYLIEANYRLDLLDRTYEDKKQRLTVGQYLRQISGEGHLSIDQTVEFLGENIGDKTKQIILCHLSSRNADPEEFKSQVENEFIFTKVDIAQAGTSITI